MRSVLMVKTLYPHWGRHTAFNSFLESFDPAAVRVRTVEVPMGEDRLPLCPPPVKAYLRKRIRAGGMKAYTLNDLRAECSVLAASLGRRLDIVHFMDAEHGLLHLPSWLKALRRLRKPPRILAMFHQPPEILETLISAEVAGRADRILVVAPQQEDFFRERCPGTPVSRILLGIDADFFKPGPSPAERGAFRCIGGGVWLRDYQALLQTAALLKDESAIEFHIFGPVRLDFRSSPNVVVHKRLSDEDLLRLYQSGGCLFLPLRNATANNVLLEGAACGLPVLSSDLPAVRTYFPGEEAVLVKGNDPEAFARTIRTLAGDEARRSRMAAAARARALELSWKTIVKEYERLYQSL